MIRVFIVGALRPCLVTTEPNEVVMFLIQHNYVLVTDARHPNGDRRIVVDRPKETV